MKLFYREQKFPLVRYVDRQQAINAMATPQQDNRTTQEKSANSVLEASGLNDLDDDDALAMNWQDGDEPDAQRNLRDELDRAKTPTPTELVVWKKPYKDRDQAPRERTLEEFDKIIEDGTAITLELYDEAPEREELAEFSLPQMTGRQLDLLGRLDKNTYGHLPFVRVRLVSQRL